LVTNMAGDSVECFLTPPSHGRLYIADLKAAVADSTFALPPAFQTMVDESCAPLHDSEEVTQQAYQVVVSLEAVLGPLRQGDAQQRWQALADLEDIGQRGGDAVLVALTGCLHDQDWKNRMAAIEAIPHVATQGDQLALKTLIDGCSDTEPRVRNSAVLTLPDIVMPGDAQALTALRGLLMDTEEEVRISAVLATVGITESSDA